ncbi:MAG: hypothetical protein ACREEB_10550 [Caulobacteraceae bacterium]
MSATVFIIDDKNQLTPLTRTDYVSEDLFQKLLADHPALLSQVAGDEGRLLLIRREAPVADSADGGGRWSLDHLFIDRQSVPVLVEVKRASDTRARREVVAQMLDYAANGVAYWPVSDLVAAFRSSVSEEAHADTKLDAFLEGADAEEFWRQVDLNLRAGRIRMVFVADRIPGELRRIVEFLNEQMSPAEVLAIEVEQFTTATGMRVLTPRLLGVTERAKSAKGVQSAMPPISEEAWLEDLGTRHGAIAVQMAEKALAWFRGEGLRIEMTKTQENIHAALLRPDGKPTWTFFIARATGKIHVALDYLSYNPAFADEDVRLGLLEKFRALPGVAITTDKTKGWPGVPLEALARPEVWDGFVKIAEDILARNAARGAMAMEPSV